MKVTLVIYYEEENPDLTKLNLCGDCLGGKLVSIGRGTAEGDLARLVRKHFDCIPDDEEDYDFYSHSEAWDCLKSIIRHFSVKEAENKVK